MFKIYPRGFLGSGDVILRYAELLYPGLWDSLGADEAAIWNRFRTSHDAHIDLDDLIRIEFKRTQMRQVLERKDTFWQAVAQIREWLHDGTLWAWETPITWYLKPEPIFDPPFVKSEVWDNDVISQEALLSGVFAPTASISGAEYKLLLLNESHVAQHFDRLREAAAKAQPQPEPPQAGTGREVSRRGRPPSINAAAVQKIVFELMDHHDDFTPDDPEWNAQARLEEAVREKLGTEISESSLRAAITAPLKAWRAGKAGKS